MKNKKNYQRIHFTGIKGVGMTSLALCYQDLGAKISGSDIAETFVTDEILKKRNISWSIGFKKENISRDLDLVITTGAHGGLLNPEVIYAKSLGIVTKTLAEALADLSKAKDTIVVCGVGGKTTTTAIISLLLQKSNLDPSYAIGVGKIFPLGLPGKYSRNGKYFVCEGDEFAISPGINNKPRFSLLTPKIIVLTNIELDHPDIYPDLKATKKVFADFIDKIPAGGLLVANVDDHNIREILESKKGQFRITTFGISPQADLRIENYKVSDNNIFFDLGYKGKKHSIRSSLPGIYNARNIAAAFAVGDFLNIESQLSVKQIELFTGCQRRFEKVGYSRPGVLIYDDYAHHPQEIAAVLKAAKEFFPQKRIVTLFQPHTYSRTKQLFKEFSLSFNNADIVGFMDIYSSAREKKDPEISSEKLAKETSKYKKNSIYVGGHEEALLWLTKILKKGDLLLTLGAGDIFYLHHQLTSR